MLFPNILITLEQIHVFETSVIAELIVVATEAVCPVGPQILKYLLFSPFWKMFADPWHRGTRAQEASQRESYLSCVRRLKRGSLRGWQRGTGTFCHFCDYSLSRPMCAFPLPTSFPESTHSSVEFYAEWTKIQYLWVRKCSSELGALKVTLAPKILLPAACIWERHEPWTTPSLWKSRWITKRISRVAWQCHYQAVA